MEFEAKRPVWDPETVPKSVKNPHLDMLLSGRGSPPVGIEAKFLELYDPVDWDSFSGRYFAGGYEDVWGGLVECRRLAERIRDGAETFRHLRAAQLLKHALGLSRYENKFRLVLVWYRVDGRTADLIEEEIGRFARAVSAEIDFAAFTYQDLVGRLAGHGEPAPGYFDYLADRYGLAPAGPPSLPLISLEKELLVHQKTGLADTLARLERSRRLSTMA